ncbi:MAG: hypothetical protein JKY03_10890 [Aureispira sp.]|nr:hypothetical protein [Aureispira sp.]
MLFHQKPITKSLFLLFLFLYASNIFAQQNYNTPPLIEQSNGLDHFPVYKASQKNSFIDSIIYNGPFITLCVHFEKPTSDGHYLFEAINSEHGWTCETAAGLCHPVLIKNIRKNGQLISDYLKVTPLDLIFRNEENTTTQITCEFQFLRKNFVHGEAKLSESLIREYTTKKSTFVEFKGIRIRTKNYPKPLSKKYVEDFNWTRNSLLKKILITLNEVPQKTPTKIAIETSIPENFITSTYKVHKAFENQLFLKEVWHTATSTIFRIQYYAPPSSYASTTLHHRGNRNYYIKAGSKKIKMRSIKNILLNQFLLKEELKNKESLKLEKSPSLYLLTYDIYFDRLPDDLGSFNLIEGREKEGTTSFNFYSVNLTE